jgi:transcriptional regulator with XRE-family HTH domain
MNDLHPLMKFRLSHTPPMTQAALARKLGVTRSCVNRIESGNRRLGIELLARAAKATGMPPAMLRPDLKSILKKSRRK